MHRPVKLTKTILMFAAAIASVALLAHGALEADGARWWSHVVFLADDRLEGRDTGSAGHRKAAEYVALEFARIGLRPAGTAGYLQPVKFQSREIDEAHSSLSLVQNGHSEPLILGNDAVISLRVDPADSVEADLVFAGFGISSSEAAHDDFQGLDVRGKIVVYLMGTPASIPGPLAAHIQSAGRARQLPAKARHRGTVAIHQSQKHGFSLGAIQPRPVHAVDEPRGPRARRVARPLDRRRHEPGEDRQAVCRFGPHVRRASGGGRLRTSRFPTSLFQSD